MRKQIVVKGIVQGVGFRQFVWRLASELECVGNVCNDSGGVLIEVQSAPSVLDEFQRRLVDEAPSMSCISNISSVMLPIKHGEIGFTILKKIDG